MKLIRTFAATFILSAASVSAFAKSNLDSLKIEHEKFVLDNGLTVLVHEDNKAPIVNVEVWYKVGSKDEPKGKSGFAHLFEHLMFSGSENAKGTYFDPFKKVGGTNLNGATSFDQTFYHQTVPTPALEMALFLESDRMGHLLGAVTEESLEIQRGVVKNEKRQGENAPYGMALEHIVKGVFPQGHPYNHLPIGSMEDLNAASMEDVHAWFKKYYGPANAVLTLSGNISPKEGLALAQKYFGHIPAGGKTAHMQSKVPMLSNDIKEVLYDNVPQTRIYRVYPIANRSNEEIHSLNLASDLLGYGKSSLLYQRLVKELQIATSASASIWDLQLSGLFFVIIDLKSPNDEAVAIQELDKMMAKLLSKKPNKKDLERVKFGYESSTIRSMESVAAKGSMLMSGEFYAGNPMQYLDDLKAIKGVTPKALHKDVNKWLDRGYYQLTIRPKGKYSVGEAQVDRSEGIPKVGKMPGLVAPKFETFTLDNGIKVKLAQRTSAPVVDLAIQFDAGYAADSKGHKLGTSKYVMSMMREGTKDKNAEEFSTAEELLGTRISSRANLDMSIVSVSALKTKLEESVELWAETILEPTFPEKNMERMRGQYIATINQEKSSPVPSALRTLAPILYGDEHSYGIPLTGSGTIESVQSITRDDLKAFYKTWINPNTAEIFAAGDITASELKELLNDVIGDWESDITPPAKSLPVVKNQPKRTFIIDRPSAQQTLIIGGRLIESSKGKNGKAISIANDILGGDFTSRVNMNIREDKHWAYGAYTFTDGSAGQRPYMLYAPVQADKTGEALNEALKEMKEFVTTRPATQQEFETAIASTINKFPAAFETNGSLLGTMLGMARYDRADDHLETMVADYQALTLDEIHRVSKDIVKVDDFTIILVGNKDVILKEIEGMDIGPVKLLSAEGKILD